MHMHMRTCTCTCTCNMHTHMHTHMLMHMTWHAPCVQYVHGMALYGTPGTKFLTLNKLLPYAQQTSLCVGQ